MIRPGTVRRPLAAAIAATLAIVLSGCVRLGVELELRPDDVARPSVVVAVEDGVLEATGQAAGDFIDQLVGKNDPADGARDIETYAQDGYTGERYVYEVQDIDRVGKAVGQLVNVVREGDEYVVSGVLDLSEKALGLRGQGSLDDLSVTVDITFPGPVTESNGAISGRKVHWEPPLGGDYEIHARGSAVDLSAPKPSPTPAAAATGDAGAADAPSSVPEWLIPVIGGGGLLILLLLGIVVWQALRVRRRNDAPQVARPPYPQPPAAPYPRQHTPYQDPHRPPSIPPRR
ncbi:LppM family (lipo)protein [Myceligenerans crystallogenes]|uniref:LppM family (lipo)protein n=1 Tax=Myceligenerans crystallogenes TaxID=316335 RepID=UPI0031D8ECEE